MYVYRLKGCYTFTFRFSTRSSWAHCSAYRCISRCNSRIFTSKLKGVDVDDGDGGGLPLVEGGGDRCVGVGVVVEVVTSMKESPRGGVAL